MQLIDNQIPHDHILEATRGAGAQSVTVKPNGCRVRSSSSGRGMKYMYISIYISISSLWCQSKARRGVLPLNTQCLQNSAETGERNVLTLGSFCLPCCVRDTAYSWFIYFIFIFVRKSHQWINSSVTITNSLIRNLYDHHKEIIIC